MPLQLEGYGMRRRREAIRTGIYIFYTNTEYWDYYIPCVSSLGVGAALCFNSHNLILTPVLCWIVCSINMFSKVETGGGKKNTWTNGELYAIFLHLEETSRQCRLSSFFTHIICELWRRVGSQKGVNGWENSEYVPIYNIGFLDMKP